MRECPHCSHDINLEQFKSHVKECFFIHKGSFLKKKEGKLDYHVQVREQKERIRKLMQFISDGRGLKSTAFANENLIMLTQRQFNAVNTVVKGAKIKSESARSIILDKIIRLGFQADDLEQTIIYLREEAPLLIHINPTNVLHHLIKDDHYRNCFEISGNNATRIKVENGLFNNYYAQVTHFERVKYGVLNILNDPQGVNICYCYGNSYLVLKNVRMRTSFTNHDTFSPTVNIACCEHYLHVLNEYNDTALKAIMQVATKQVPFLHTKNVNIGTYKEVQYHGPVRLRHDVESLVINPTHRTNKKICDQLREFELKYDVPVFWMDDYQQVLDK